MKKFLLPLLLGLLPPSAFAQTEAVKVNSVGRITNPTVLKIPSGKGVTIESGGNITAGAGATINFTGATLQGFSGGGGSSYTFTAPLVDTSGTVTIENAAADGSTKGAASFTAADFNASSGLISLDYTNGQAATSSVKGFLTAADWTTFNSKLEPAGTGSLLTALNASALASGTIPAARMPAFTGDITTSSGAVSTTLATVNSNVGSFGDATTAVSFTVNAKGLVTAVSNATITGFQPLSANLTEFATVDPSANGLSYVSAANYAAMRALLGLATVATSGSAADLTGVLGVGGGGTGLATGTSGGVPYFSSSSAITSSAVLTTNNVVVGGGAGAAPVTRPVTVDSSGNIVTAGDITGNVITGNNLTVTTLDVTDLTISGTITGVVGVANGGTAKSSYTKGDILVAQASTTLNKLAVGTNGQVLTANSSATNGVEWGTISGAGTVTSVAASVPSFLSISGSPITSSGTLAISLSGTALPVANGGTGQTSYTNGQLLIGNTTNSGLDKATLTGTSGNVTVTNSAGGITLNLGTTGVSAGTYGSATAVGAVAVDTTGRITSASNVTVTPAVGSITGLGTGVATALAVNVGSAGAPVVNGGALGTPSSGTLTNASGLPVAGITSSTSTALGVGSLELGHATDTTLSRSAAGVLAVEGVVVPSISSTNTLTNKRVSARITSITSSATPTVNTDNCDVVTITALAAAITSMTTNLSGTPDNFDQLEFRILDNGTARAITWGASFASGTGTLPATTTVNKALCVYLEWDAVQAKWMCQYAGSYP